MSPRGDSTLLRLATMVVTSEHAVVLLREDGTVVAFSAGATSIWGYEPGEVVGQHVRVLAPPKRPGMSSDEVTRQVARTLTAVRLDTLGRRADGQAIDLALSVNAVVEPGRRLAGLCALAVDTTEQRRTERELRTSEQRFRQLAEYARDVVFELEVSPTPRFTFVNSAAVEVLGLAPVDLYQDARLPLAHVVGGDAEKRSAFGHGRAVDGQPRQFEFQRPDGTRIILAQTVSPVYGDDGTLVAVRGILWNVSAREQATQALEAALQRERRAADRLVAIDRIRHHFLTAVSHELRTPLTSVVGFATLLRDRANDLPTAEIASFADRIADKAHHLEGLIDDLLELRAAQAEGEPAAMAIDLTALVRAEVEARNWVNRTCRVALSPAEVAGSTPRLTRLVRALLENIDRHTATDTCVWVTLERADSWVVLTVEDNGPGWPQAMLDNAMDPFAQGPGMEDAASPGMGLGLALVAASARFHGGKATIGTSQRGGALVSVTLPAANTQASTSQPQSE